MMDFHNCSMLIYINYICTVLLLFYLRSRPSQYINDTKNVWPYAGTCSNAVAETKLFSCVGIWL